MVRVQAALADAISGSTGGFVSSEARWAACRCSSGASCIPTGVRSLLPIASLRGRRPRSRSRSAASAVGQFELDPKWRGGDYYDAAPGDGPHEGLAIARHDRADHVPQSDDVFTDRFGREMADRSGRLLALAALRGRALSRLSRRQARAPLRRELLSRDRQGHGPARHRSWPGRARDGDGAHRACRCCTIGIRSDMLYPAYQQKQIRDVLQSAGGRAEYVEIDSPTATTRSSSTSTRWATP